MDVRLRCAHHNVVAGVCDGSRLGPARAQGMVGTLRRKPGTVRRGQETAIRIRAPPPPRSKVAQQSPLRGYRRTFRGSRNLSGIERARDGACRFARFQPGIGDPDRDAVAAYLKRPAWWRSWLSTPASHRMRSSARTGKRHPDPGRDPVARSRTSRHSVCKSEPSRDRVCWFSGSQPVIQECGPGRTWSLALSGQAGGIRGHGLRWGRHRTP